MVNSSVFFITDATFLIPYPILGDYYTPSW